MSSDLPTSVPDPWTGRDGAYGLGPGAPAPPWHPVPGYPVATPPPWVGDPRTATTLPRRSSGYRIAAGVALLAAACAAGFGVGVWRTPVRTVRVAASSAGRSRGASRSSGGLQLPGGFTLPGGLQLPTFGLGNGGTGTSGGGSGSTGTASATESAGLVDIDSQLGDEGEEGAGTGMVLSSDGYVLTNNHVVNGATAIDATVVSSGATYTATVVGTDPTKDVAVMKLSGASGMTTARFGASVAVGARVIGVGNAGGVGGTPSAAPGTVVATDQKLTATDDGSDPEKLTGMIETNADIIPGDSGGPLYNGTGRIVGMDTAAGRTASGTRGYAIPIATARAIATQIRAGVQTSAIHLGYPGFLGIEVGTRSRSDVPVVAVLQGGPAQRAGIVAGDDITAIDGTRVAGPTALHDLVDTYRPGQHVTVTYSTVTGASHSAPLTLATGPAD